MSGPGDIAYAGHWLAVARGDLAAGVAIIDATDLPPRLAGEFAQRASEKALKAVIALGVVEPPRTHDLARLADLVPEDVGVATLAIDLHALGDAFLVARCPDPDEPPMSRADAGRLIDDATRLVAAVSEFLARAGVDVRLL